MRERGAWLLATALAAAPAAAAPAPSAQLRCDGLPEDGRAPPPAATPADRTAKASERLNGPEGVAACNEALAGEANDMRRAQLILAAAIHEIEAGQYDAAIAAARRADADRPAFAAAMPFRLGPHLVALDIEALALLKLGRIDDSVARALELAAAAPYDINAQLAAAFYVNLSPQWGPAETAFYDNLVRLHPSALATRAFQRELGGDAAGALADYDLLIRLDDANWGGATPLRLTRIALAHALAGDAARAQALIARAEASPLATPRPGESPNPGLVELSDLYRVWRTAHDGDVGRARIMFLARSQWIHADAMVRAGIVRMLRAGAAPADLTGGLAQTPDAILAAHRAERREAALDNPRNIDRLFTLLGDVPRQEDFSDLAGAAWQMEQGRIIDFPQSGGSDYRVYSYPHAGSGRAVGYALLLHVALRARGEGKNAFTLFPLRTLLTQLAVRFGNSGDDGLFAGLTFTADRVVADLTPLLPQPAPR